MEMNVAERSASGVGMAEGFAASQGTVSINAYRDRPLLQWWLVIVLMLLMMLGTIDRQIVSLLINPIKEDLGLTDTQISLFYGAAFAIANIAFTLPAGYLADRMSRRVMVGVGAVVWSGMTTLCGAASNFLTLMVARAGVGFGEGVIGPGAMSLLRAALSPERRGRGFSVFSMSHMAGTALALIVGGALIGLVEAKGITRFPLIGEVASWQAVLIFVGLLGAPLGLLMFTVPEPPHGLRDDEIGEPEAKAGYGEVLRYMRLRGAVYGPLIMFQAAAGLSALSFGAWIAAMIGRSYGLSIPQIGATLGMMILVFPAIGLAGTGVLLDKFNARGGVAAMSAIGIVISLFYWLTAWTAPLMPSLSFFWTVLAIHMLASGAPPAIGATIMAAITPARIMGSISAIQLFIHGLLAAAIGPIIVALISDNLFSGQHSLAYALSLASFVYGLFAAVMLEMTRRALFREKAGKAAPAIA